MNTETQINLLTNKAQQKLKILESKRKYDDI